MISSTAKKARMKPIVGTIILAASIGIILFSGTSGITQSNINRHLQHFAEYVSKQAAGAGKQATFTYGATDIEGWGFNKHATVGNIALELADKSSPSGDTWNITTAQMQVAADPINPNGLVFEFPGPVNVDNVGHFKAVVTFPSPLKYVYSETQENQKRTITHTVHLPGSVTISNSIIDDNTNHEMNVPFVINYDENPIIRLKDTLESNERDADYEFHHLNISTSGNMQMTMALVASHFNVSPSKDNRLDEKYTLKISDFVVKNPDKTSKTYSVNIDLASHSDMANEKPDAANAIGNSETTINEMLLTAPDFKVNVTGAISTTADDALPFGSAAIDIDNVSQFVASELIPESARKSVAGVLQKVTGQSVDKLTHASIPIKREKGGTLYVGDISFKTLAASVLTDMLQAAPPAAAAPSSPAPVAPSDAKPAPKDDSEQHGEPAKTSM